jgi:predicted dehydrogenase/threonine dehydrogenase-like Zn-dependent dehydrogenase
MKQVLRKGLKDIVVDEVPDPVVVPHHILIRPSYSLISSGTETANLHREGVLRAVTENPSHLGTIWNTVLNVGPLPTLREVRAKFSEYAVLGYSGAGTVIDKHPTAQEFEIGERVAYGGEGTGHGEVILAARNLVVKVPDPVTFEHACFATIGSIAMNAVRIGNIGLGERVGVLGLGLVGQLIAQLVALQGGAVLAVDLRPERVELARLLGAEDAVVATSAPESARSFTNGRGLDCVFIAAAAKSDSVCQQAVEICRDRGRIVDVGAVRLSFPWQAMYLKEIQFFMARAYGPGSYDPVYEEQGQDYPLAYVRWTENRNMQEFLRLLRLERVQVKSLITHQFPLEDATKAYETIMNPDSGSLAVLLRYPSAASGEAAAAFVPQRKVPVAAKAEVVAGEMGVALVGAGNLSRWVHLPILRRIPNVRLRAICSASGARSKGYALRFKTDYCCSDYQDVLSDPRVQVVVIVTRNVHHAPQALAALRAGKDVFVEKPLALTLEECRSLWRAVEETGRQLTVGFNRRFAPFYLQLKRELAQRRGPAVLNCRVNSPGISGDYWMSDPAEGGAILGEACHFVDLMYWLVGSEPISVSAFSLPTGKQETIGQNNLAASFRFEDGSVGNLTYCTLGSATSGGERVEAFAPGLGVATENFKRLVVQRRITRARSFWLPSKGYRQQMESFFARLRQGQCPEVTVADGIRATIGCLRMLESARTLRACSIDWREEVSSVTK